VRRGLAELLQAIRSKRKPALTRAGHLSGRAGAAALTFRACRDGRSPGQAARSARVRVASVVLQAFVTATLEVAVDEQRLAGA
jgi:hypothetical protein